MSRLHLTLFMPWPPGRCDQKVVIRQARLATPRRKARPEPNDRAGMIDMVSARRYETSGKHDAAD